MDLGSSAARAILLFSIILGVAFENFDNLNESARKLVGLPYFLPERDGMGTRGVKETLAVAGFFFFFFFDGAAVLEFLLLCCSLIELLREAGYSLFSSICLSV